MRTRMSFAVTIAMILICVIPLSVSAGEGSFLIEPEAEQVVTIGPFQKGVALNFGWECLNGTTDVDFTLTNETHTMSPMAESTGGSNSVVVEDNSEYSMNWKNYNTEEAMAIKYWYYTVAIKVNWVFSSRDVSRGETVNVSVIVENINSEPIRITNLGIHFDWMAHDVYKVNDGVSSEPLEVPAGETYTVFLSFVVPDMAKSGLRDYDIAMDYEYRYNGTWDPYQWASGTWFDFWVEDIDSDGDGVTDTQDLYPDDPSEWEDKDGDGFADNNSDAFPNDPDEWEDKDGNGIGDNEDAITKAEEEAKDFDEDGVPDYRDAFPKDESASVDSDGDGHPDRWNTGKGPENSREGLTLDHFPDDPDRWKAEEKEDHTALIVILVLIGLAVVGAAVYFIVMNRKKE